MAIENTADLRRTLAKTIDGVRNGTIAPNQAQSVAALAGKILQSARLDLDVMKFAAVSQNALAAPPVSLIPPEKSSDDVPTEKAQRSRKSA